ncbi:MAG: HAD-IA family hydrolase [Kiritimatiellae bacterium]|nr:HAD-IA family hydrolase [Kiritimatiellia bacterium]
MKSVFFDLDGTLIDSRADLAEAVNHTRRDAGLKEISLDEVIANVGCGAKYLLEKSVPELEGRFEEILPHFYENYDLHLLDHVSLYPGAAETLCELANRGWKMGIVTNKPNFATHKILKHLNIAQYFGDAIIAGGDCEIMKPSPVPLKLAAEKIEGCVLSESDWMVGDNWTDLECGKAAGVSTAFCSFGFGHLKESVYTAKLDSFGDLLKYCK